MAEDSRFVDSLREANLLLLSKLHVSQRAIWKDVNVIKSTAGTPDCAKRFKSLEFRGYGPDRTPVSLRKRAVELSDKERRMSIRRFSTPTEDRNKENMPSDAATGRVNSILRTPKSQRKKQSAENRHHVTFNPSTPMVGETTPGKIDHSVLGYDWIAGMLENTSYLSEKNDSFFDELKEFRRVNRKECSGSTFVQQPSKSPLIMPPEEDKRDSSHKCSDTYVLDQRLFPVPIHGSQSYCGVCKTRKPAEYENEESYVRVSVPRSTLQSPHRVKPHRRKSFDPTDTVSLSKHCLLGWESSKPAVIPSQSSLDLRAHTGISKLNALNWSSKNESKDLFTSAPPLHSGHQNI